MGHDNTTGSDTILEDVFMPPFFSCFACDAPDTTLSSVSSRRGYVLCMKGVYDMIMKDWDTLKGTSFCCEVLATSASVLQRGRSRPQLVYESRLVYEGSI